MDVAWLTKMFVEAGLDEARATEAAEAALVKLLQRDQGQRTPRAEGSLVRSLVKDPLVSFNRILGRGDGGLPFMDDESGALSPLAFSSTLTEIGIDPAVATAYAKVIVEAFDPKDLFTPVWRELGRAGDLELETLRQMDWTPLREKVPDFPTVPSDQEPTQLVPIFHPGAKPTTPATAGHDPLDAGPPRPRGPTKNSK